MGGYKKFFPQLKFEANRVLLQEIPMGSQVAFFDYPTYTNVGDILIYLGTLKWFQEKSVSIKVRQNILDGRLPALDEKIIIVCQGGGNFGDLYNHQKYREKLVSHYAHNKIVFLPQTVYFENPDRLIVSSSILNAHENLAVFVRDKVSLQTLASSLTRTRIYLCPDMAIFLYPLVSPVEKYKCKGKKGKYEDKIIYVLRRDIEKSGDFDTGNDAAWVGDWGDLTGNLIYLFQGLKKFNMKLGRYLPDWLFSTLWLAIERILVSRAVELFQAHDHVVTSRLHGHLLAMLMEKKVTLLDNSYGKNRHYFECWHEGLQQATFKETTY